LASSPPWVRELFPASHKEAARPTQSFVRCSLSGRCSLWGRRGSGHDSDCSNDISRSLGLNSGSGLRRYEQNHDRTRVHGVDVATSDERHARPRRGVRATWRRALVRPVREPRVAVPTPSPTPPPAPVLAIARARGPWREDAAAKGVRADVRRVSRSRGHRLQVSKLQLPSTCKQASTGHAFAEHAFGQIWVRRGMFFQPSDLHEPSGSTQPITEPWGHRTVPWATVHPP